VALTLSMIAGVIASRGSSAPCLR